MTALEAIEIMWNQHVMDKDELGEAAQTLYNEFGPFAKKLESYEFKKPKNLDVGYPFEKAGPLVCITCPFATNDEEVMKVHVAHHRKEDKLYQPPYRHDDSGFVR